MPASLSQLSSNRARLERTFDDGESFYVEYRPAQLTPRQLHRIQALRQRPWDELTPDEQAEALESTTKLLAETLIATDALDSQNRPIVCTLDGLQDVSYTDQAALLQLIQENQRLGEGTGTGNSGASSTPISVSAPMETSSPASANGISSRPSRNGSASASPK